VTKKTNNQTDSAQRPAKNPFTVFREIKRFGLQNTLWGWMPKVSLGCGIISAFSVPWGQAKHLGMLLALHGTLLGFAFVVFSFVTAWRSEFTEPVLRKNLRRGLNTIRNVILHLFFPIPVQLLSLVILAARILFAAYFTNLALCFLWRVLYASAAMWSILELTWAVRTLFTLAIMRHVKQYKDIAEENQEPAEQK